jgi:hypothetical protein
MFEDLARLQELSRFPMLSSEQKSEAAKISYRLREGGFTNDDISRVTGGKWKPRTIKGYTRGAKVLDTTEKDALFNILSEMITQKKTTGDVDAYLKANTKLQARHTSIEKILELDEEAEKSGTSIPQLAQLSAEISKTEHNVPTLLKVIEIVESLTKHGYEKEALYALKIAAEKYGGPLKVLEAIITFTNLEEIKDHHNFMLQLVTKAQTDVTAEEAKKNRTIAEALIYKTYVDIAKDLVQKHSFDLHALGELVKACEKFGRPPEVLEAVNMNQSLQTIRADTETEKQRLKEAREQATQKQNELATLNDEITKIQQDIGGIEAELGRIETLQIIADMMAKPDKVNLTKDQFLQVASAILNSIINILDTKPTLQGDWSKALKRDAQMLRDEAARQINTG